MELCLFTLLNEKPDKELLAYERCKNIHKNTGTLCRSLYGRQLLMDVWPKIRDLSLPLVLRRVLVDTESGQSLLKGLGLEAKHRSPGNKHILLPLCKS